MTSENDELRPRDWALILTLTSAWLVCLVLHLNMVFGDGEFLPAFVPAFDRTDDGTPVVVSLVADRAQGGDPLEVGDRLLSLNSEPLSGISPIRFQFLLAESFNQEGKADLTVVRDARTIPIELRGSPAEISWSHLPPVIGYATIALLVLLRAPGVQGSRLFFAAFMSLAIFQTGIASGTGYQVVAGRFLFIAMGMISFALVILWLITFPRPAAHKDPKPRVPAWVAFVIPVLWALPRLNYYVDGPLPPEDYILHTYSVDALFSMLVIVILGWNYRCVDAANRRKIRWVLIGVYLGFVPITVIQFTGAAFDLGPWYYLLQRASLKFYVAVPVSLFIAMRHFNLFDVDRLISGSVWYTLLIVSFSLIAEVLLEPVAGSLASSLGADPDTGQMIFVGLLAALAIPVQTHLRPRVEHLFFPGQKTLKDAVEELINEIAATESKDMENMALLLGTRISTILGLHDCAIYLYEKNAWVPVFKFGHRIQPEMNPEQTESLHQLLEHRQVPIRLKKEGENESGMEVFEGMDAELVVPFQSVDGDTGFICLGRKRSKDIYTNTDISLLAGVAIQVSLIQA